MYTGPPVVSAECIQHLQGGQWKLVDSLLGGTALNYIGHRACIRGSSAGVIKERKHVELSELARQQDIAFVKEKNRLHKATRNGAWLRSVPHSLNGTELSWE